MILNFGSLNIDHVYQVEHFVKPGETITCNNYSVFAGGKGFNQSIAIARSGAKVCHVGQVGKDGLFLKEYLEKNEAETTFLKISDTPTGHAMIQVDKKGENCIIIYGGANRTITKEQVQQALLENQSASYVLLQNETNDIDIVIDLAFQAGKKVAFNPSPFAPSLLNLSFSKIHTLIMNEIECQEMGRSTDIINAIKNIRLQSKEIELVITRGKEGVLYSTSKELLEFPIAMVKNVVDTTAAGDTFTGYFLGNLTLGKSVSEAIQIGIRASALCIQRKGAAESIPFTKELEL